jgi:hypothetical protein
MRANLDSPATRGVYGPKLGGNFGAEDAPFIVTRTLQRGEIAVTEVCVDRPLGRLSDPIPRVDGYMICLLLRDLPNNSYWEDGREVSVFSPKMGQITIHDLRQQTSRAYPNFATYPVKASSTRQFGISAYRSCRRYALPTASVGCSRITPRWRWRLMPHNPTAEWRQSGDRSRADSLLGRRDGPRK